MNQRLLLLFPLFVALFLSACASSKSLVPVEEKSKEFAADSLKAKFTLSLKNEKGEMQELSGVLFAVQGIRYRLELSGPFGVGVASLLWNKEGWRITLPTEKLYIEGQGYMIGDPSMPALPFVNIHQLAGIFYGDLLPASYKELSKKDSLDFEKVFAEDALGRPFQFVRKKASEEILSLMQMGVGGIAETIYYENPKEYEKKRIPSKIRFFRDQELFLEVILKKVQHETTWGNGVWLLNIPQNYSKWNP
jgi:outer membrane lipoprotein-sorting protein